MDILVIDDEANIRKTLSLALELEDHRVIAVSNGRDGLARAESRFFDMVFLDIRLGTEKGTEYIGRILAASPWIKIIVITAYASVETAVEAIKLGAADYLPKPFTPAQISALTSRVAAAKAEARTAGPESGDSQFGTRNPAMQRSLALARRFAATDAPILIQGEPGTGRTHLARLIHSWGRRAGRPFGVFVCAAQLPEKAHAELFGAVVAMAAGDAVGSAGRIQEHADGTLLLEGIEELPLQVQSKLARFFVEGGYEGNGEAAFRRAGKRILATAPPDLDLRAQEGGFRADLLSRLSTFRIVLPALRERPEDILAIAHRFLAKVGVEMGRRLLGFSEGAEQALLTHPWPGNIPELRDVVERAATLCRGTQIGTTQLGLPSQGPEESIALGAPVRLEKVEEAHIRKVLGSSRSLEEAARILGIDTATLWRKRKKYGL